MSQSNTRVSAQRALKNSAVNCDIMMKDIAAFIERAKSRGAATHWGDVSDLQRLEVALGEIHEWVSAS